MEKINLKELHEIHAMSAALQQRILQFIFDASSYSPLPLPVQRMPSASTANEIDREITQTEAAKILGIGNKTIVQLCENHRIPFYQATEKSNRKFMLSQVLTYKEKKGGRV